MSQKMTALICVFSLVGCGAIRDDLRYPGGAGGRILDERTFDASRSKSLQLWRASLMLAIAAQIGEGSVEATDADAFARQLGDAAKEINFAAAEIGYPAGAGQNGAPTFSCTIFQNPGTSQGAAEDAAIQKNAASTALADWDVTDIYDGSSECSGYYVNFESHVARVETRIVRAMLTALPTDKAKVFLTRLAKGDLLSALMALPGATKQIAGSFHRGAGAYRVGTEAMAAMAVTADGQSCDHADASYSKYKGSAGWQYTETRGTVLTAAACLGLSQRDLFDSDVLEGDRFYQGTIRPRAFHAMMRVARASCVALPLMGTLAQKDYKASLEARKQSCDAVVFKPLVQPLTIDIPADAASEDAMSGDDPTNDSSESEATDSSDAAAPAYVEDSDVGTPRVPPTSSEN